MLSWSFGQYARHLRAEAVVRYEDLIATGGGALERVAPAAREVVAPLHSRNANPLYSGLDVTAIGRRLLATSGPQWDFYPRDAVRELVDQLASPRSGDASENARG
jgi:hypothetical protein